MAGIELLWISNSIPDIRNAIDAGIDWIFLDIETYGKDSRQPAGSFVSNHTIEDVKAIRAAFPDAKILLRINPLQKTTEEEVNRAVDAGINAIMLPFFKTIREVNEVLDLIGGRCAFWPLVETLEACEMVIRGELSGEAIARIHVGLNDLRLQLGCNFMFSPLLDPRVRNAIEHLRCSDRNFGIGGVSTLDSGLLTGRDVLSLHHFLGSSAVILSQDFRRIVKAGGLSAEVSRIREHWMTLGNVGANIVGNAATILGSIQMLETREG